MSDKMTDEQRKKIEELAYKLEELDAERRSIKKNLQMFVDIFCEEIEKLLTAIREVYVDYKSDESRSQTSDGREKYVFSWNEQRFTLLPSKYIAASKSDEAQTGKWIPVGRVVFYHQMAPDLPDFPTFEFLIRANGFWSAPQLHMSGQTESWEIRKALIGLLHKVTYDIRIVHQDVLKLEALNPDDSDAITDLFVIRNTDDTEE